MPLSPMLVQYLVGLCALKWDASAVNVDVTLGDMVEDAASGTRRDVDVTVTADTPEGLYAFKGYEVKHWSSPLDVADVEALALKLKDMPSVTHGAIVSTSGYTAPAIRKAEYHGVDLFVLKRWTKPIEVESPDPAPVTGFPLQNVNMLNLSLVWPVQGYWMTIDGPLFHIERDAMLFDAEGAQHKDYGTFGAYASAMVVRSTGILLNVAPIADRVQGLMDAFWAHIEMPEEPQWPWSHTLDSATDEVYVRASDEKLYRINTFTIYGELKWEIQGTLYCVMEKVPTGELFAQAVVGLSDVPGRMSAMIIPTEGRTLHIHNQIQLETKHLNSIRDLKIALPREDNSVSQ